MSAAKFGLIKCFNWPRDKMRAITRDVGETSFHVVPMGVLSRAWQLHIISEKKYRRVIATAQLAGATVGAPEKLRGYQQCAYHASEWL